MITAIIGYFLLLATLLIILIGAGISLFGLVKSDNKKIQFLKKTDQIILFLLSTAILIILIQLVFQNYQFVYVSKTTQNITPILLRIAALWAQQEGSILFWIWLISIANYILHSIFSNSTSKQYSIIFLFKNLPVALLLLYLIVGENPFYLFWTNQNQEIWASIINLNNWAPFVPVDGSGLNPLLHHYAMIIHPPILYLGFITMWIPTIISISNIFSANKNHNKKIRTWSIISWIFLTAGIALGSRWAFDLLSWGGYWSWDAVETASLLPWISQTIVLHSIFNPTNNKNKNSKTQTLIMFTNFLITFEIFITRSGIVNSVHAFAQSDRSIFFFTLLAISFLMMLLSLFKYIKINSVENKKEKIAIKKTLFSIINISLLIYIIYLFLGLIYPIIQQKINNIQIIIDQRYYQIGTSILWTILLLLLIIYQWVSIQNKFKWLSILFFAIPFLITDQWLPRIILALVFISIYLIYLHFLIQKSKTYLKISSLLIHSSLLIVSIGIVGLEFLSYEQVIPISSQSDQSEIVDNKYFIEIINVTQTQENQITLTSATIKLSKQNHQIATLIPGQSFNENSLQSINLPAHKYFFLDTLSLSIAGYDQEQQALLLLIQYHRLSNFLWGGVIGLTAGGIILAFGKMKKKGIKSK